MAQLANAQRIEGQELSVEVATKDGTISDTALPAADREESQRRRTNVLLAQRLDLPEVPQQYQLGPVKVPVPDFVRNPVNNSIRGTEETVNNGIEEFNRGVTWTQNQIQNRIEDFKNSPTGQQIRGARDALGSVLQDTQRAAQQVISDPIGTGAAIIDNTKNYLQQVPGAVQEVIQNPSLVRDIIQYAPAETLNDIQMEYLRRAHANEMPPSMKEHGRVENVPGIGRVVVDPVGNFVLQLDGPDATRYRMRLPDGSFSAPVNGVPSQLDYRPAIVDRQTGFALTQDGWRVKGSDGRYGDAMQGVVAPLTDDNTGVRTWGVVVNVRGASDGSKLFVQPGDAFRVRNPDDNDFGRSYAESQYAAAVMDGRLYAKDLKTGVLLDVDSQLRGTIRLPQTDGSYSPARQGQLVNNRIDGQEYPGVLRTDLNNRIIELAGGVYRVKLPGDQLSPPIQGTIAELRDPGTGNAGIGIVTRTQGGDYVFYGTNGVQVKNDAADAHYSRAVAQGVPQTVQSAHGETIGVRITKPGPLQDRAVVTAEGVVLLDAQGNQITAPLRGRETVLNGKPVVENTIETADGAFKLVTDGTTLRVSDSEQRNWSPEVQGRALTVPKLGVGIELKDAPGVAVFPAGNGQSGYSFKNPETNQWSATIRGEQLVALPDGSRAVKQGDRLLHQNFDSYVDLTNPGRGWQSLSEASRRQNSPPEGERSVADNIARERARQHADAAAEGKTPPPETIDRMPTGLERVGNTINDAREAIGQFGSDLRDGIVYSAQNPGEFLVGEGGIVPNTIGAFKGTAQGLGDVLFNQTGLSTPSGNSVQDFFRGTTSALGEAGLAYGVAITSPSAVTVGLYGARAASRSYSQDAQQAVNRGEDPTSVLSKPDTQLRIVGNGAAAMLTVSATVAPQTVNLTRLPAAVTTGGFAASGSLLRQAANNARIDPDTGELTTKVDPAVAAIDSAEFVIGQQFNRFSLGTQLSVDLSTSTAAVVGRSAVTGQAIDPNEALQTVLTTTALNIAGSRVSQRTPDTEATSSDPQSTTTRRSDTPVTRATPPEERAERPVETSPTEQTSTSPDANVRRDVVPRTPSNRAENDQVVPDDQQTNTPPSSESRTTQPEVRTITDPSGTEVESTSSEQTTSGQRTSSAETEAVRDTSATSASEDTNAARATSPGVRRETPALEQIRTAREAAELGNAQNPEVRRLWESMVRDPDGRFQNLHQLRWFENGAQPAPDLNNAKQRTYFLNSLEMQEAFLTALESKSYGSFTDLANRMHGIGSYKSPNQEFPSYQRFWNLVVQPKEIGNIVSDLAVRYGDPLPERLRSTTSLPGTSSSPEFVNGAFMPRFAYPLAADRNQFMQMAGQTLKELEALPPTASKQEVVDKVADFVAYTTAPHYWGTSNFGVTMNMGNALLQKHGLNPVPHGVIDFALFGLERDAFRKVFSEAVAASNPGFQPPQSRTPEEITQNLTSRAAAHTATLLADGTKLQGQARSLAREVDAWNTTGQGTSPGTSIVQTFFKLDADLALPKSTAEQMRRFESQLPDSLRREVADARGRLERALEGPLGEANRVVVEDRDRLLIAMQREVSRDITRAVDEAKQRPANDPESLRELDAVVQRGVLVKNAMRFLGAQEIREHYKIPLEQITRELPWYSNALLSNRPKDSELAVITRDDPRFTTPQRAPTTPSLLTLEGTVRTDQPAVPKTTQDPEVARLFTRYGVTRGAEESGMRGQISFGTDPADGTAVAIKQAPLEEGRLEAARLSRMAVESNPNLPRLRDLHLDEKNGDAYLVMDRGGRPVLDQQVTRRDEREAVGIGLSVLNGLETSHRFGVIHRDINPRNVLIAENDPTRVTLIDFGLAVDVGPDGKARGTGFGGVPQYMPPEQFARGASRNGEAYTIDRTVDTYATAALIAHMAQGKPAFEGASPAPKRLLRDSEGTQYENPAWRDHWHKVHQQGPDLSGIRDEGLKEVLQKAMSVDPAQRYQSAREFADALRPYQQSGSPVPSVDSSRNGNNPRTDQTDEIRDPQATPGTRQLASPVGGSLNQYRETLDRVQAAIANRDASSPELREFFREVVRDNEGHWSSLNNHNRKHVRSWFPGRQEEPQFYIQERTEDGGTRTVENTRLIRYLEASVNTRREAVAGLADGEALRSFPEFRDFMNRLHGQQAYKATTEDPNHPRTWDVNVPIGTPREQVNLKDPVVEAATRLRDPRYLEEPIVRSTYPGISPEGQTEVRHGVLRDEFRYPDQRTRDEYMRMAQQSLIDIARLPADAPKEEVVKKVADFVTYSTTPHYWGETNVGLTMNVANGILRTHGMRGVEHGVLDIYMLGLQPETVRTIFQSEVARSNMELVTSGKLRPPQVPTDAEVQADVTARAERVSRQLTADLPALTTSLSEAQRALEMWKGASSQEERQASLAQVNLLRTLEAADRQLALPAMTLRQLENFPELAPRAREALERDVKPALEAMNRLVSDPKTFFDAAHQQLWSEAQRTVAAAREQGRNPSQVREELDRVTEDSLYFKRALRELGDRAGDEVTELKRASAPASEIAAAEARQRALSGLRKQYDQPFDLLASVPGYENAGLAFKSSPVQREERSVRERLTSAREGVDLLLAGEQLNPQQRQDVQNLWERLVRDSSGRPEFAGLEESKFWGRGTQQTYDSSNQGQLRFFEAGARTAQTFAVELDSRGVPSDFQSFKNLVIELHKLQAYQGDEAGVLRSGDIPPVDISTFMPNLRELGARHGDPTLSTSRFTMQLPGFAQNELPNVEVGYYRTTYNYPSVAVTDKYLQRAHQELLALEATRNPTPEQVVDRVSQFYRYGIQSHYFKDVNQSLFMNMSNTTLERYGLKGFEHGMTDFAVIGLNERAFRNYFRDEVARVNPGKLTPAPRPTTQEWTESFGQITREGAAAVITAERSMSELTASLDSTDRSPSSIARQLRALEETLNPVGASKGALDAWIAEGKKRGDVDARSLASAEELQRRLDQQLSEGVELNKRLLGDRRALAESLIPTLQQEADAITARLEGGADPASLREAVSSHFQGIRDSKALATNIAWTAGRDEDGSLQNFAGRLPDRIKIEVDPQRILKRTYPDLWAGIVEEQPTRLPLTERISAGERPVVREVIDAGRILESGITDNDVGLRARVTAVQQDALVRQIQQNISDRHLSRALESLATQSFRPEPDLLARLKSGEHNTAILERVDRFSRQNHSPETIAQTVDRLRAIDHPLFRDPTSINVNPVTGELRKIEAIREADERFQMPSVAGLEEGPVRRIVVAELDNLRRAVEPGIRSELETMRSEMQELGISVSELSTRTKQSESLIRKLMNGRARDSLNEVTDLIGGRYVFTSADDLARATEVIERRLGARIVEKEVIFGPPFRTGPYGGVHYVVQTPDKRLYELQLRTDNLMYSADLYHKAVRTPGYLSLPQEERAAVERLAWNVLGSELKDLEVRSTQRTIRADWTTVFRDQPIPRTRGELSTLIEGASSRAPEQTARMTRLYQQYGFEAFTDALKTGETYEQRQSRAVESSSEIAATPPRGVTRSEVTAEVSRARVDGRTSFRQQQDLEDLVVLSVAGEKNDRFAHTFAERLPRVPSTGPGTDESRIGEYVAGSIGVRREDINLTRITEGRSGAGVYLVKNQAGDPIFVAKVFDDVEGLRRELAYVDRIRRSVSGSRTGVESIVGAARLDSDEGAKGLMLMEMAPGTMIRSTMQRTSETLQNASASPEARAEAVRELTSAFRATGYSLGTLHTSTAQSTPVPDQSLQSYLRFFDKRIENALELARAHGLQFDEAALRGQASAIREAYTAVQPKAVFTHSDANTANIFFDGSRVTFIDLESAKKYQQDGRPGGDGGADAARVVEALYSTVDLPLDVRRETVDSFLAGYRVRGGDVVSDPQIEFHRFASRMGYIESALRAQDPQKAQELLNLFLSHPVPSERQR